MKFPNTDLKKLNKTLIIISFLLLFILTGCDAFGGTPLPKDVNYNVGRDGLILDLVNEENLDEIYEQTNFPLSLSIENLGAHDVVGEEQAIITVGFDPFFIEPVNAPTDSTIEIGRSNAVISNIKMLGKSRYAPSGSKTFLFMPYFKTKPIEGQRVQPKTQVFASICYPYSTTFSELVCIDFDAFADPNARSQVCRQQDLSSSDQGAPVAINLVEVENYPVGNLVKPIFTVHIQNVGDGTVLKPVETGTEFERICAAEGVNREDFNTVAIQALLSNSIDLECTPQLVKLDRGNGISRCELRDEDIQDAIQFNQNYQAALTVNLSYVYLSTLKKDIEIKRLDPYAISGNSNANGECEAHQVSDGGECVNKCDFCAQNPTDSVCQPSNSKYDINWNGQFACACSANTCNTLYTKGLCVPNSGFCPAASYCCANPCKSNEIRSDSDGKCYPKCSTCTALTSGKQCACGQDGNAAILSTGSFCSSTFEVYSSKTECQEEGREEV